MKKIGYDMVLIDTKKELDKYLDRCEYNGLNILYTRGLSSITITPNSYELPQNNILYNANSNSLLLLPESLLDYLKEQLDKKEVEYHEVKFNRNCPEFKDTSDSKKLIFIRESKELYRELYESKKQGEDTCIYYPKVKGRFKFRYYLRDLSKEFLFLREIRGLLEFGDKILLFIDKGEQKNLKFNK